VRYEAAGVSLGKAEEVVERLQAAIASTGGQVGGFAGLFPLDEERFLAATTDGVGTKISLSRRAGRLRDAGRDLAAHCIDDVITTGADPLFLLDYVASGSLELGEGCAILGGETAELPGIYREGELDFAGTCVGLVRREDLIDGSRCRRGDVVLGLPSSGLHTNGFSLVRRLIDPDDFDADLLLEPHRLYLEEVRELRARTDVKALAHVTGGGILANLTRVLPEGIGIELDWDAWGRPPVYTWLTEKGVPEEEQRRVFNVGIGMCAVVPASDSAAGTVIGTLT
jgi:phosphoribosylformylglycinamidine cyclo-ligase